MGSNKDFIAYYSKRCYNTAVLPMGGDKELPQRPPAQYAEQPRLVTPDGAQLQWPAQTATPETPIYLKVFGAGLATVAEKK